MSSALRANPEARTSRSLNSGDSRSNFMQYRAHDQQLPPVHPTHTIPCIIDEDRIHHGAAMFNQLRRPVPSKAALRILYQLAYVTSGTAMGIATLCVEERRRKTQLVQKIADNAKRVRQSPKYRRYSTAAVAAREDAITLDSAMAGYFQPAPRDEFSPSEVERGYRRTSQQHRKAQRRKCYSGKKEHDKRQEWRERKDTSGLVLYRYKRVFSPKTCSLPRGKSCNEEGIPRHASFRVYKRLPQERRFNYIGISELAFPDEANELSMARDDEPDSLKLADIQKFFQLAPWTYDGRDEKRVAQHLFLLALEKGTFEDIRSLYYWLYARGGLGVSQIYALCDACQDLPVEGQSKAFLALYRGLFATPEFRALPGSERVRCCLQVAVASTHWDCTNGAQRVICERVAGQLGVREALSDIDTSLLLKSVDGRCDERLKAKDPDGALRYALMFSRHILGNSRNSLDRLELFRAKTARSLELGHFSLALHHIQMQWSSQREYDSLPYIEQISAACVRHNSYNSLAVLLRLDQKGGKKKIANLVPRLSNTAKMALARTCLERTYLDDFEPLVRQLLSALPEDIRRSLADSRASRSLQDTWTTTSNFELTWGRYKAAIQFAHDSGDVELIKKTTLIMIDVCNAANRSDRAIELLQDLNQNQPQTCQSLARAAVSLAQLKLWDRLEALLQILPTSGVFVQDNGVNRCFDHIIQLFARHHTAADTWKFVTNLIRNVGFAPTNITSRIVLCSFVEKRHLSFVMHWIRYLGTLGQHYNLIDKTVANLMSTYYLDQRPAHELLIWYCRHLAPALDSSGPLVFRRVITEAAAHDIRKGYKDVRKKADLNIVEFERLEDSIARPVGMRGLVSAQARVHHDALAQPDLIEQPEGEKAPEAGAMRPYKNDLHPIGASREGQLERSAFESNQRLEHNLDEGSLDPEAEPSYSLHKSHIRQEVEGEMIVRLSQRRYEDVLETYFSSLSASGLPVSVRALTMATDASLRLRGGDRSEADGILEKARLAGMDVSCALRPLLEQRISSMRLGSREDATRLRELVMEWYNAHAEKGLPVSHHVGIKAAGALISAHHPEHGINLLSILQDLGSVHDFPLSIDVMTSYLRCYAALENLDGIKWTIYTVLHKNIPIDLRFLQWIRVWRNRFTRVPVKGQAERSQRTKDLGSVLLQGLQHCRHRRLRQRYYTKVFGRNLVKIIKKMIRHSKEPLIPVAARKSLEADLFAMPPDRYGHPSTIEEQEDLTSLDAPPKEECALDLQSAEFQAMRARVARSIRSTRRSLSHNYRNAKVTRGHIWEKQYRAFLRKDLVLPSGRLVAFRYRLCAKEQKKKVNVPLNDMRLDDVNPRIVRLHGKHDEATPVKEAHGYVPFDDARVQGRTGQATKAEVKAKAPSYVPFSDASAHAMATADQVPASKVKAQSYVLFNNSPAPDQVDQTATAVER